MLDAADRWEEVPSHRIEVPEGVDTLVAVGGGSAIDTAKAASAASGLPLVSVPTTYSGAEWTEFFGVRDPDRKMRGGGAGARLHAIVYEPKLTLDLPLAETVGTALNALAHCAEALYVDGHNAEADAEALAGARLIGSVAAAGRRAADDLEARTELLRGACHAGAALGKSFLALGHAMAQALGGRYGAAARRDERALPAARSPLQRGGRPGGASRASARRSAPTIPLRGWRSSRGSAASSASATSACPSRSCGEVAAAVVERAGAKANPRPGHPPTRSRACSARSGER